MQHPECHPSSLTKRPELPKATIDKVPVLLVQHQVPNQFETPLVEPEENPASPQEYFGKVSNYWYALKLLLLRLVFNFLCSNMRQKDRNSFLHVLLRFISPGNVDNVLGTHNDRLGLDQFPLLLRSPTVTDQMAHYVVATLSAFGLEDMCKLCQYLASCSAIAGSDCPWKFYSTPSCSQPGVRKECRSFLSQFLKLHYWTLTLEVSRLPLTHNR
ncbi:hypothetical protein Tco_1328186 [Tanacetum coccineum]